jgi:predicted metal-binding protein
MAEKNHQQAASQELLRSYRGPWKGQLLLVCRKCEKKLKGKKKESGLGKLKRALKERTPSDGSGIRFHVIGVSCLDVCPKGGVTVCTQKQMGLGQFCILNTDADITTLIEQCRPQAG